MLKNNRLPIFLPYMTFHLCLLEVSGLYSRECLGESNVKEINKHPFGGLLIMYTRKNNCRVHKKDNYRYHFKRSIYHGHHYYIPNCI